MRLSKMNQHHNSAMNTVEAGSLDELLMVLKGIRDGDESHGPVDVFYRGHASEKWDLDATIYRETGKGILFDFYFTIAWQIRHEIEAMLNIDFNLSTKDRLAMMEYLTGVNNDAPKSALNYLITLRHYGFPSPLLDWTKSTGIALHFAASSPNRMKEDIRNKGRGAVFVLVVPRGSSQIRVDGDATITIHQTPITTDRRHFKQQAVYTTANWVQKDASGQVIAHHFANKRYALSKGHYERKCTLWKVIFDNKMAPDILSYCDENNINDFTLFDSAEGLLKTLRNRYFVVDPAGSITIKSNND